LNGQEIRLVMKVLDKGELVFDLQAHLFSRTLRPSPVRACLGYRRFESRGNSRCLPLLLAQRCL